ncbi:CHAT domain-containing protein [Aulosira sp. FACHB-615]|uniref:CHAT domain-containing protein n=1 Tax=Aulosira sp. FACHB-615 TaxID=2692777 RepID=UPI001683E1C0|nr:CHAT domain-containing protein [Aulosira sp. FACHB-615]MBD2489953.1 CHAT domain-containing protein [Aulosira sp. FACHB-615]
MNEQRQQAYLNLIRSLLDSSSGEEPEILAANQELLDAGFVQTVEEVAQMCSQHGDEKTANRLQSLAMQLREALNINTKVDSQSLSEEEIQVYFQFLMQVIQAIVESEGNPQVVYPLLINNIDKLDEVLAERLHQWRTNRITEVATDEEKYLLAISICVFSDLIAQFPLGNKACNIEIAIAGYEIALTVFTHEAFPEYWALAQNNLGNAYRERIVGDKANNIEQSVACSQAALTFLTREAFPYEWALTQNNLGHAYGERIHGDKTNNIEQSIAAFQAALKVYTREAFPRDWATTQNGLGIAYFDRIRGDKAKNIEQSVNAYQAALSILTHEAFPYEWAMTQMNLGNAYRERVSGDKANNIEQSITAYQAALSIYTREAFPYEWVKTQVSLGTAYRKRILGDKANNIEQSITAYQAALNIYTRKTFPQEWALIQIGLGSAYHERILGDKANNIEQSIAACQAVLEFYTREAFPQAWADTQNILGNAYRERILGDKANNIEQSIAAYQAALNIHTREAFPESWAMIQNNLGAAYRERIVGDRASNIERNIAAYQAALNIYTPEAFPERWAWTQNNLGLAYLERKLGNQDDNIERSIAAFQAALSVYTREVFPQEWALAQNNLGIAYIKRILGDETNNLEQSIAALQASLEVYTRKAFPQYWARSQGNLGVAYTNRILGDKANNIESGIAAYQAALEVYTREAFPQEWAQMQERLGNAYLKRILGDKANNIEQGIAAYQAALEVYTHETFPEEWAQMQKQLGNTYLNRIQGDKVENTQFAITAYEAAINGAEFLREQIISGDTTKQKLAEEWTTSYIRIVQAYLELGDFTKAIEYAERSKTRNLVELILKRDSKTIFPSDVFAQLEQLRDKITRGQDRIQNATDENHKLLAEHLQKLRQQRNELQDRYLPVAYGFKLDKFQATLDEKTTIIEWYVTRAGFETFIITRNSIQCLGISKLGEIKYVANWIGEYFNAYYETKIEWINSLTFRLNNLAKILQLEEITKLIPKNCTHLVLIPHLLLHLFPLHTLPLNDGELLYERFPDGVSYAPSLQILQQLQMRDRPDFKNLFAIQNPTEDLNYTDLEVQVIQSYFHTANVLKKTAATLTAINNSDLNTYHCAHFSCHGYFNLTNASKSALILADSPAADTPIKPDSERYLNVRAGETHDLDKCLTLDKIFSLKLEKCRLVTLSACETGLIDFENTSDEYIGLPSGFLLAGSKAVVSSLWTVSDLSTAFLMMKFYENLQTLNSVSLALNQAQQWLRNLTTEEFEALLVKYDSQIEEIFAQLPEEKRLVARAILRRMCRRKPHPFAAPFYWAGFTATGL